MEPPSPTPSLTSHRTVWRWLWPLGLLAIWVMPAWIFLAERDGLTFLDSLGAQDTATAIFPLFGLYALTLVWTQVMLGSLMPFWKKLFPQIFYFHRSEGVFALLFATTHPTLLAVGVGLESYVARDFLDPSQVKFLYFGYTALFTMYLTVGTALLMKKRVLSRWWRKIHVLNYVVFAAAWTHSWNLGSDVQSTPLRILWLGYGLTVIVAIIIRFARRHAPAI